MTRRAEEVLADQKERTPVNIGSLNAIRDMADPGLRPVEIAYDRLGTRLLFPDYFERGCSAAEGRREGEAGQCRPL